MKTRWTTLISLVVATAALAPVARAEDGDWDLIGRHVLRLSATVGGKTPQQRTAKLDERLNEVLSLSDTPLRPEDIVIKMMNGSPSVVAKGILLVTATAKDAELQGTTAEKLSQMWLSSIRKTIPQMSPRVNLSGA